MIILHNPEKRQILIELDANEYQKLTKGTKSQAASTSKEIIRTLTAAFIRMWVNGT